MVDLIVCFKLRVCFQVFVYCGFRVVSRAPRSVWEHIDGHVFNDRVKNDAITSVAGQWSISLQFGEDMVVGVVAV